MSFLKGHKAHRSTKPKVVVIGGFGWHDIGDEAMPHADVINLRKQLPNLDIVMLSPNPAYTAAYHGERSIADLYRYLYQPPPCLWLFHRLQGQRWWPLGRARNQGFWVAVRWLVFLLAVVCRRVGIRFPLPKIAKDILDELATADLLFNVGGGNINSVIRTELYQKTLAHLSAKVLKLPAIISGQTIGPFFKKLDAFLARQALDAADMLTLRDKDVSRQRLAEIGVTRPRILDTADDAMTLPAFPESQAREMLLELSGGRWTESAVKFLVAMNMNGYALGMGKGDNASWSHDIALMSEIADRLVERHQAHVLLVPTDYCPSSDDRPLLQEVKSTMRHGERAACVQAEVDDITLKGLIGLADLAIGSRYHFNVFAVSMGVPCIGVASGVYQMTKLEGLMALYGLPQCFIKKGLDSLSPEELWATVESVLAEREQIVSRLQEMTPVLQECSLVTIQRTVELLSGSKEQ